VDLHKGFSDRIVWQFLFSIAKNSLPQFSSGHIDVEEPYQKRSLSISNVPIIAPSNRQTFLRKRPYPSQSKSLTKTPGIHSRANHLKQKSQLLSHPAGTAPFKSDFKKTPESSSVLHL
jgi:hypothetical protein